MQFNNSFNIIDNQGNKLSLRDALLLAKNESLDMVYDEQGLYTSDSWYFCYNILVVLKQYKHIKDFQVLEDPPVEVESKTGVIY